MSMLFSLIDENFSLIEEVAVNIISNFLQQIVSEIEINLEIIFTVFCLGTVC